MIAWRQSEKEGYEEEKKTGFTGWRKSSSKDGSKNSRMR